MREAAFGRLETEMLLLQARTLRADFCYQLLQQVRVCLQRLVAGLFCVTFVWESREDPLGDLPNSKFLIRMSSQEVDDRLAKIKRRFLPSVRIAYIGTALSSSAWVPSLPMKIDRSPKELGTFSRRSLRQNGRTHSRIPLIFGKSNTGSGLAKASVLG